MNDKKIPVENAYLHEEVVSAVREAIKRAQKDMDQWRKDAEPTAERMRQKINVFRNGRRVR